jgi:DNA-directed RNA polymerase specialized sigma24 family protein
MVWHPVEADDVLQKTNLVLWQKAAEFDESRPFLPWAIRFAQLQALAYLKRLHRQHGRLLIDDDLATTDDADQLVDLLRDDPASRRAYREFVSLHASLQWDSAVVPAAARGVSPVGAAPLPPTHHADCSPTLS